MIKPEPSPCWRWEPRGIGAPKKRCQKSPEGSSSPKGTGAFWAVFCTCVVEILTTTGPSSFAKVVKSCRLCVVATDLTPNAGALFDPAEPGRDEEGSMTPAVPAPTNTESRPTTTTQ